MINNVLDDLYNELVRQTGVPAREDYLGGAAFLINDETHIKEVLQYAVAMGYEMGNNTSVMGYNRRVRVDRYNSGGVFVRTYDSITDAAASVKVTQSTMSGAVNNNSRCKGEYWIKAGEPFSKKCTDEKIKDRIEQSYSKIGKAVEKLDMQRVVVRSFRSVSKAAASISCSREVLTTVIVGNIHFRGHFWRYKV